MCAHPLLVEILQRCEVDFLALQGRRFSRCFRRHSCTLGSRVLVVLQGGLVPLVLADKAGLVRCHRVKDAALVWRHLAIAVVTTLYLLTIRLLLLYDEVTLVELHLED